MVLRRLLRAVAAGLAPLTLAGAIGAYLHPPAFLVFADSFLLFFALTMFALGTVLEPGELATAAARPGRLALGLATQYTVMPALGFAAAMLAGLPPALALGFVVVACAPGAMASNVIVYLAGGAAGYSIALTTLATLVAPLATPALVELLGGVFVPVPFADMVRTIVEVVLLPLFAGLAVRRGLLTARGRALAADVAPAAAAIAIIVICSYAVAANQARIAGVGPLVLGLVVGINALGYGLGWWLARLYRFDHRHRVALSVEIGMQNAGLGVALALAHFGPEAALPGALFAVWSVMTSAGLTAWLRRRRSQAAGPVAGV